MKNLNENENENNNQDEEFSKFLFNLVQEFYNDILLKNYKPRDDEYNIFSAIILQNKKEYKIVTFSWIKINSK